MTDSVLDILYADFFIAGKWRPRYVERVYNLKKKRMTHTSQQHIPPNRTTATRLFLKSQPDMHRKIQSNMHRHTSTPPPIPPTQKRLRPPKSTRGRRALLRPQNRHRPRPRLPPIHPHPLQIPCAPLPPRQPHVAINKTEHGLVPDQTVFAAEHKVRLVGEGQKLAGDAARLQRVEDGEAVGHGQAEVVVGVDGELGGGPVVGVLRWVPSSGMLVFE